MKLAWRSMFGRVFYKWVLQLKAQFTEIEDLEEWLKNEHFSRLPPTVSFPLQDGGKAHEMSETNRTVGKIVLAMID
jgi:NADPH:quinone reductase-like Zn-dependent oxidoreductase